MRTRRRSLFDVVRRWPCAAAPLLLAACGGGGDSGGAALPGSGSSSANQINSNNYIEVSQAALASSVVLE